MCLCVCFEGESDLFTFRGCGGLDNFSRLRGDLLRVRTRAKIFSPMLPLGNFFRPM